MKYDTVKLRQFINEYFGSEDLRMFLFDYFRSVYDDLTDGLTKSKQIALLLEYCHRHKKFPDLLVAIQQERAFFQPHDYVQDKKEPAISDLEVDKELHAIFDSILKELLSAPKPKFSDNGIWINSKTGHEMVKIPAGSFLYRSEKMLIHRSDFWIAKTPVTNAEYAIFVEEMKKDPPKHWEGKMPPSSIANHPVVYVSWYDAKAYAEWAQAELPTEEHWEKAARGNDGRAYPWGNEWVDNHCNTDETNIGDTSPVGQFSPQGDSVYGCVDMSGNIWEWTQTRNSARQIARGGSWAYGRSYAHTTYQYITAPEESCVDLGFRIMSRFRWS